MSVTAERSLTRILSQNLEAFLYSFWSKFSFHVPKAEQVLVIGLSELLREGI